MVLKVGNDIFGVFLMEMLNYYNVNIDYVWCCDKGNIVFVFVNLDVDGECFFDFYVDNVVYKYINEDDLVIVNCDESSILYFCLGFILGLEFILGIEYILEKVK